MTTVKQGESFFGKSTNIPNFDLNIFENVVVSFDPSFTSQKFTYLESCGIPSSLNSTFPISPYHISPKSSFALIPRKPTFGIILTSSMKDFNSIPRLKKPLLREITLNKTQFPCHLQ